MASGVIEPPTVPRYAFDVLDCETVGPGRGPLRLRLRGRASDGRVLLLDLSGAALARLEPARLSRAIVAATDRATADGASIRTWHLQADEGRFEFGPAQLFVHEDVTAQATAAVPPRAVPLARHLLWRLVFLLLATRSGRRWLERRATRA